MLRYADRLEELIVALLLAGMTLLTSLQVVLRYVFNSGLLWAMEAIGYMFAWMVLIGISYGIRVHAHMGVDAAVKLFPRQVQRALGLLAVVLCLTYAGYMLRGSWTYVGKLYLIGVEAQDIPLPRWLLASALPVGFGLFVLRLLQMGYRMIRGREISLVADEATDMVESFKAQVASEAEREGRPS